ncbi:LysR family transcriptional regulator [Vibrio cionasavignyae]|uniref:LysR family transcriptional regulator n=1 Tax=Vibrio cionasavignyae TaxID=2910252 RepID=UPI003D10741E
MISLDLDSIRAFLAINDHKSFTKAADSMGSTQATLSVKLKRLENKLGVQLVERTPRQVRLSSAGEAFLPEARELISANDRAIASLSSPRRKFKLGVGCHVFGPEMQMVLSRLKEADPSLQIELSVESSTILTELCNSGSLHAVIIRSDDGRYDGEELCPEYFGWYASAQFDYDHQGPLPIANLKEHCGMRNVAMQVLDKFKIQWHEAFIGNNMTAIVTAIEAGMAVGIFPHRAAPRTLIEVSKKFGLPKIPPSSVLIYSAYKDKQTRSIMKLIVKTFSDLYP